MESSRLLIRNSTFEDCLYFTKWEDQDYIKESFTMGQERDYNEIAQEFAIRTQDPTMLQLTIVHKNDEAPIGRIWVSRIDKGADSADITRIYIGEPDYLRKGYGEESLRILLEQLFIFMHMERVTLDHLPLNKNAARLYLKLGFRYEGIARHAGKKDGRYVDLHLMSLLRGEYRNKLFIDD